MQQKDEYGMTRPMISTEEALKFTPFLKGSDAAAKRIRRSRFSPYKLVLFVHDLMVVSLALGLGVWLTGFTFFMRENLNHSMVLLVFSLIVMAFFPTYNLYSYHLIFLRKNHLVSLIKSFGWSLLTIGFITFLYGYPSLLEGRSVMLLLFLVAVGLLVLSRFFWDHLLYLIKSVGMSFLAIGTMALIIGDERPLILTEWLTIPVCFSLAAGMLLLTRCLLVQVVFNKWMRRNFRRQVVVVGSDQEAKEITSHIINHNGPFWITGIVGDQDLRMLEVSVPKKWLGELKDLPEIVEQMKIDEVIVTDENIDQRLLIFLLDYCTSAGLNAWFPPKLLPIIDMKLIIDSFCGLPMIRLCSQKNSWVFNKIKHGVDALVTLPFYLVLLPVFLTIGIAIKLSSPGPVFYKAQAVGKNGRLFKMYKFRSMRVTDSSDIHKRYVTKLIKGEISEEGEKDQVFKITDDPRVTSVGKFLRKYSIDELPQIINVLRGDMSLVGPRPCLPYEYELYKDWQKKRMSIRPGITGLWQVAGRSAVTFEDMVLLDLYYIYNRDLLMDMNVIYETIFVVFGKRGAY